MQKEFQLAVDIEKKILTPSFEVNTLDLKTIKLKITITKGMTLVDLTDITVRMSIRKPDGNVLFQDCQVVNAKGGQVEIILENQAYVLPGSYSAEIMCFKGTDKVAVTGSFSYRSIKGIMDDKAVESKSEFTAITKQLDDVQATVNDLRENGTGIDAQARQEVEQVSEQLADIAINVKQFGAKGDGVTDDTTSFKNAFTFAVKNNYRLNIPKTNSFYKIVSNEQWDCPRIASDGATLKISGDLRFLFVDNIELNYLNIETDDNGGYGVDDNDIKGSLFKPKSPEKQIDYVDIKGINIIAKVNTDKRLAGGIRVNECKKWLSIKNVYGENCGSLIITEGISKNINVSDISGRNIETLVYLKGVDGAKIDNLSLINTKEQSTWWISKNKGVGIAGKDTLLVEGRGQGIRMTNIRGEWCIERPIYCQVSDVYADQLESINTGGFKFIGGHTERTIKNVFIGTAIIRENDEVKLDGYGAIYGCENIYFDNLKIFSTPNATRRPFEISGNNGSIVFNNIECYGLTRALFAKTDGTVDSMVINRMRFESDSNVSSDAMIITKESAYADTDCINKLVINSFEGNVGSSFTARSLLYNPSGNKLALDIKLNNVSSNGIGIISTSLFGALDISSISYKNVEINNKLPINSINGTGLYTNSNITTSKIIENLRVVKNNETNINYEIIFNKPDSNTDNILNYIKNVSYTRKNITDTQYELPINASYNWIIKIQSKLGGYAEYMLFGGIITERLNTGTNIAIGANGTTPATGKLSIWINSASFLFFRNRINGDDFKISAEKIS